MAPPSRGRERVGIRSRRGDRSGQGQRPVEKALRGCRMHEQDGYQRKKRRHNPAHHVDDHQRHRRPFDVVDTIGRVLWAASCVPSLRGLVCMAPHTARTTAWRRRRRVQGSTARQSPATHRPPVRMRPAIRLHAAQWHMRRSLSERLNTTPRGPIARPDRAHAPRAYCIRRPARTTAHWFSPTDGSRGRYGLQPLPCGRYPLCISALQRVGIKKRTHAAAPFTAHLRLAPSS